MKGTRIGYIRVSSSDQNPARQIAAMEVDKIFEEEASAKSTDRPVLKLMLDYCRESDTVVVHSMDRLARNLDDLRKLVYKLTDKGVKLQFIKENLTFSGEDSPMSMFLLSIMGAFGEFERKIIRERQAEGIAQAKKRGVILGRARTLNKEQIEEIKRLLDIGHYKIDVAKKFGISKQTLFNYLRREGFGIKKRIET